ncbi:hypothetical protein GF406_26685 [candidate division KSB1 bacterium]|nr:hypothetical protein [candidate division KSB1 bacterium]
MILPKTKRHILEKILTSPHFAHSHIHKNLLTYLVEKSISGEIPKETTIAIDVFDKDADFDSNEDTLIRVHVYKLREKLAKYYAEQGQDDDIRLCIPKGHYKVNFNPIKPSTSQYQGFALLCKVGALFSLILFPVCIYLFFDNLRMHNEIENFSLIPTEDPVWNCFISSEIPTLIVPGTNYFFAMESKEFNETLIVRNTTINSTPDLTNFLAEHDDLARDVHAGDYAFLGKESAWSLRYLFPLFFSAHKKVELEISSALNWEDFEKYHLIYIGSYKSLGILNNMLFNLDISYTLYPHQIIIEDGKEQESHTFSPELVRDEYHNKNYNKDYALVAKMPGPNNNSVLIIAGFYFIGVYEAAKHLADPDLLAIIEENLTQRHGKVPEYFEMLLEISGFGRTGFSTTIVYSDEIQAGHDFERN